MFHYFTFPLFNHAKTRVAQYSKDMGRGLQIPGIGETRTADHAAGMLRHSLTLKLGLQFSNLRPGSSGRGYGFDNKKGKTYIYYMSSFAFSKMEIN